MSRSKYALAVAAVLAGCASRAHLRPLDPSHPASPSAPEAAVPETGTMLRERSAPAPHSGHRMHGGAVGREPGEGDVRRPAEYTCPMHPEVRQSRGGRCPKCGMTLGRTEEMRGPR